MVAGDPCAMDVFFGARLISEEFEGSPAAAVAGWVSPGVGSIWGEPLSGCQSRTTGGAAAAASAQVHNVASGVGRRRFRTAARCAAELRGWPASLRSLSPMSSCAVFLCA